jgi:hypothetical protein
MDRDGATARRRAGALAVRGEHGQAKVRPVTGQKGHHEEHREACTERMAHLAQCLSLDSNFSRAILKIPRTREE